MNRRMLKPARRGLRWLRAGMAAALIASGFATLLVRLEVTQEGYRLSELRSQVAHLQESNRQLAVEVAELNSHQRLRALASKYGLGPPARGQVVVVR